MPFNKKKFSDTKVIILCGGKGTRLGLDTKFIPKPMVKIGSKPILLHILNYYYKYGYKNFILALGYKGKIIKKYFKKNKFKFSVRCVNTGLNTLTGGRLLKLKKVLSKEKYFMMTYGDGLSNQNLNKLEKFHLKKNKVATMTTVRPLVRFGFGEVILKKSRVVKFKEKPQMTSSWVNGGFFVFNEEIFKFLENKKKNDTMLEKEPLERLVRSKQINAYKHLGFWQCLDTPRDKDYLIDLIKKNKAPWIS